MSRFAMCPRCGRRLRRDRDECGVWDGETYVCDNCYNPYGDDYDEDDDTVEDEYGNERLSVYDAALIWLSNGMDEDYMFGYSEAELEKALR